MSISKILNTIAVIMLSLFVLIFVGAIVLDWSETTDTMYSNIQDKDAAKEIPLALLPFLKNASDIRYYFNIDSGRPMKWLKLPAADFVSLQQYIATRYKRITPPDFKRYYGCSCPWPKCFEFLENQGFDKTPILGDSYILDASESEQWIFLDHERNEVFLCRPSRLSTVT